MEYNCRDCGIKINEGEAITFGICDNCWRNHLLEKENSNVRYNVLAEVRALLSVIDEEKRNWLNGEPENFLKVVKQAEKVSEHFS